MKLQKLEIAIIKGSDKGELYEDVDFNYKKLTGIAIVGDKADGCIIKSFELDSKSLFPKDFDAEFLATDKAVSPDERFLSIEEKLNQSKLNVEIQAPDTNGRTVVIYLKLEK